MDVKIRIHTASAQAILDIVTGERDAKEMRKRARSLVITMPNPW